MNQPGEPRRDGPPFRVPLLFDLTRLADPTQGRPEAPRVYYLTDQFPEEPRNGSGWRTALGVGMVLSVGISLGLLLACLLVW